jgi:ABC-2 type transport system permease protein
LPFLFVVIIGDFLSGSVFPLDIFSKSAQNIFYSLPFPYLVFFPLQVYLGKLTIGTTLNGIVISLGWLIVLWFLVKVFWEKGLKKFCSEGI